MGRGAQQSRAPVSLWSAHVSVCGGASPSTGGVIQRGVAPALLGGIVTELDAHGLDDHPPRCPLGAGSLPGLKGINRHRADLARQFIRHQLHMLCPRIQGVSKGSSVSRYRQQQYRCQNPQNGQHFYLSLFGALAKEEEFLDGL